MCFKMLVVKDDGLSFGALARKLFVEFGFWLNISSGQYNFPRLLSLKLCSNHSCSLSTWMLKSENVIFRCSYLGCFVIAAKRIK